MGLTVKCKNGSNAVSFQPTANRGVKPGGPASGTLSYTFSSSATACKGTTRGGFSHVDITNAYNGAVLGTYYPPGHPDRPPGIEAGQGKITRWITCEGPDGPLAIESAWYGNIATGGEYELPALTCPAGMVAGTFGADWDAATPGIPTQLIVPATPNAQWVRDIVGLYPDCLENDCRLELLHRTETGSQTCGDLAELCPNWYVEAVRGTDHLCKWGPYDVDLDRCSVYREPGKISPNARINDNGGVEYLPWPAPDLTSAPVATLRSLLASRYGPDERCAVLGEKIRHFAPEVAVPDAVLVCDALGVQAALSFAAKTGSVDWGLVFLALLDAVHGDEPTYIEPDCGNLRTDGVCLDDDGSLIPEEEPEPAPAGGGIPLPPNCVEDPSALQDLRDALNAKAQVEDHHLATDKHKTFTPQFKALLRDNFPTAGLDLTNDSWNHLDKLQRGNHPPQYHKWVYRNMELAAEQANGDPLVFTALFEAWVKVPIDQADPLVLRWAYWRCL